MPSRASEPAGAPQPSRPSAGRPPRSRPRSRRASGRSTPTTRTSSATARPSPPPARSGRVVFLATPRIEKPGEANLFRYLTKQGADGLLVRNAGGLYFCADAGVPFVADFSLNAANELTVELLKARGALRVTASYDLSVDQLDDLLAAVPPDWLEVVIHQQIPMFHMEHCVFCAFLSPGTDKTNCGRPCDHHDVKLRDRVGDGAPAQGRRRLPQHALQRRAPDRGRVPAPSHRPRRPAPADRVPRRRRRPPSTRIIGLYRDAIAGRRDARSLWQELKATGQYGVTRGALAILG